MLSMLDVMSSTRLFTNFGVTYASVSKPPDPKEKTHRRRPSVQVIQVLVEGITVKLYSYDLLCDGIRDTQGLLQALEDPLAILVGVLMFCISHREKA